MKSTIAKQCLFAVFAALALSAYKPKKPVAPPPPPPPPPAPVIPPRPYPPLSASPNMPMPPLGANGLYVNINADNTASQATWNFRSAYNVAALNCLQPQHGQIVVNYRAFLRKHAAGLAAANRGVDADFRKRFGAGFVRQREAFMTKVYNFYAFPPTVQNFCDAALAMSNEADLILPAQLGSFAAAALPRLDVVFEEFYRSYAQYRADLAAWDAAYGPPLAQPAPALAQAPPLTGAQAMIGAQSLSAAQPLIQSQPVVQGQAQAQPPALIQAQPVVQGQPQFQAQPVVQGQAQAQPPALIQAQPVIQGQPQFQSQPIVQGQPPAPAMPQFQSQPVVQGQPQAQPVPPPATPAP